MKLEIRHLQLVKAIHEAGTVTEAASRVHLTQSAVSHQLKGIEESLGVALFRRTGKRMMLTPAGERLFDSANSILAELTRTEQEISATAPEGIVRISTECYTCYHWLPTRLKEFSRELPRVEVRIVADATRAALPALLDGKIDIAIVNNRVRNAKIVYKKLFDDELVVVMHPEHALSKQRYVSAEDLQDQDLILYNIARDKLTVFKSVLIPARVSPRSVMHIELTEAIIELVKAGLGIGVLARWAVDPHVRTGMLATVPLTKKRVRRTWSAATIRSRTTPNYVRRFLELMAGEFVPAAG